MPKTKTPMLRAWASTNISYEHKFRRKNRTAVHDTKDKHTYTKAISQPDGENDIRKQ